MTENFQVVAPREVVACLARSQSKQGPIDMFFTPNPTNVVKGRKEQGRQKTINELCRKELRAKVSEDISKWFYDAEFFSCDHTRKFCYYV